MILAKRVSIVRFFTIHYQIALLNLLYMKTIAEERFLNISEDSFTGLALEIFRFQFEHNPIYRSYAQALQKHPGNVDSLPGIPFLPIEVFKIQAVKTTEFEPVAVFESSGTTQTINSRHYIKDIGLYYSSFLKGFEKFYGNPGDWCILGLLPSYLERSNSSLVVMVNELIRKSGHPAGGFYLYDYKRLYDNIRNLEDKQQKILLIGVSFALMDFAEQFPIELSNTVVMETGGMKGRRKEIIREELHGFLQKQFGLSSIHSEYGMTELLSQAYSKGNGLFETPPWMKILVRNEDDPLDIRLSGSGIVNVIDFANIYSCSFLSTADLGKVYPDGKFEIAGRLDNSDIRGCSLLAN